ncbi:hypothetical protein CCR75_002418 [Bremia lactucae]|uniref:Uncharacterized protein n=1 Tax=Bremia lactucae TaxID=4779 RepID=A0A976FJE3_BRELC|nr:hypothetical protein CCR75_002418 [Bremia lactucae]
MASALPVAEFDSIRGIRLQTHHEPHFLYAFAIHHDVACLNAFISLAPRMSSWSLPSPATMMLCILLTAAMNLTTP